LSKGEIRSGPGLPFVAFYAMAAASVYSDAWPAAATSSAQKFTVAIPRKNACASFLCSFIYRSSAEGGQNNVFAHFAQMSLTYLLSECTAL